MKTKETKRKEALERLRKQLEKYKKWGYDDYSEIVETTKYEIARLEAALGLQS